MKDNYIFRAKRQDNKEWIVGHYVHITVDNNTEYDGIYTGRGMMRQDELCTYWCVVDPETVSLCSGLRDSNGEMIFEGDIMFLPAYGDNYIGKVTIVDGNFGVVYSSHYAAPFLDYAISHYGAVKIGNIYDNPELLDHKRDHGYTATAAQK